MQKTLFNLLQKKYKSLSHKMRRYAPHKTAHSTTPKTPPTTHDKKWVASVKGHYPIGPFCCEVYFNLYEDEGGNRTYEEFKGREFSHIPRKADFSVKAQVDAWANSKAPLHLTIMEQNFFNLFNEADLAPKSANIANLDKRKLH